MTGPEHHTPPRVVVGVDGSEPSRLALRWAAYVAGTCGAVIDAVMAWEYPPVYGWSTATVINWDTQTDYERALEAVVEEVFGAERPPGLRLVVREGNSAKMLLDESHGATMLVVGSRGHGGFAGVLLGSVSMYCAEHATCPVMVVHGAEPPPTG